MMERQTTEALYSKVLESFQDLYQQAAGLTDQQLDQRVPAFGGREVGVRQLLYQCMSHAREHSVHLNKILQQTGAPGAQPSEAQLILVQVAEALGALHGALARLSDADLDRQYEEHTPRKVLEHVAATASNYARYIREGMKRD
jgi:hypothetical protein